MSARRYLPFIFIVFPLLFAIDSFAQGGRLPRDPDKLISRAQSFWTFMVSGQRTKALELVSPERRDVFLASSPMPMVGAKVVGVDITDEPSRATVRVQVDAIM